MGFLGLWSTSKYSYEELKPDHIRLLRITSTSGTLKCKLAQYPIHHAPEYHAISYSWGGSPVTEKILCNKKVVKITLNLLQGLRTINQLFGSDSDQYIWVDAISIRQDDQEEKSAQVQQMYQIFANAKSVYIWLGIGGDNSDMFMQRLVEFAQHFQAADEGKVSFTGNANKTLDRLGLPPMGNEFWTAFGHLVSRPWFRRLWILQEIMGRRETVIICGNYSCNFDDFHALYRRIYPLNISWLVPNMPREVARHFSQVFDVRSSRKISIAMVFSICGSRDCLEPLDRVYGLLGLLPEEYRSSIQVDYSQEAKDTYWKVWLNAFRLTILYKNDLRLLDKLPSRKPLPELPSWSPNIASWSEETAQLASCRKPPRFSSAQKDDHRYVYIKRKYSRLSPKHLGEPELSFPEEETLRALGVKVDEVATVVPYRGIMSWPPMSARHKFDSSSVFHEALVWLQECYQLACKTAKDHGRELDLESFARTIIGLKDSAKGDELKDFVCAPVYKLMYNRLTAPDQKIPEEEFVDEATLDWYLHRMACVQDYRVVFTTKEGRLGLSSHRIKPGDTLTILFGGTICYALRKRKSKKGSKKEEKDAEDAASKQEIQSQSSENNTKDGESIRGDNDDDDHNKDEIDNGIKKENPSAKKRWRLICPAYVSGMMCDEVYKLLERGEVHREFFEIT